MDMKRITHTTESVAHQRPPRFVPPASRSTKKAFTLLLAVLVSSILLALGLAIFNVASKQVILASIGRDSHYAFYAADTGIECALYWDFQHTAFDQASTITDIACGSGSIPPGNGSVHLTKTTVGSVVTTTFAFSLGPDLTNPCTNVTVTKNITSQKTTVESYGYNNCVTTSLRRTERAIRAYY
jgi:hypothetical protein